MKNKYLLRTSVIAGVTLAHIGLIALAWQAAQLPDPIEVDDLTMVDLGGLGSAAPPPPPPAAAVKPQTIVEKKPEIKPEPPKVKAVVRNDKPADLTPPKQEPPKKVKPVEIPKPKPVEQPKVAEPTKIAETKSDVTDKNSHAQNSEGKAGGQAGGQSDGKAGGQGTGKAGSGGDGKGGAGNGSGSGAASSNQLVNGGYITRPAPKYPPLSEENGEEGRVEVRIVVEPDGRISSAEVVKSSRYRRLDQAALNAVKAAQYQPHRKNGVAMRTAFTVGINFQLP